MKPSNLNYRLPAYKCDRFGNIFFCIHCDKSYSSEKSVKLHLGETHADNHYFCSFCGGYYETDWSLKRHQNIFRYNCKRCDYCSNHFAQYRVHVERVHKVKLKPKYTRPRQFNGIFECKICGYQVLKKHPYETHMKSIHNQETNADSSDENSWTDLFFMDWNRQILNRGDVNLHDVYSNTCLQYENCEKFCTMSWFVISSITEAPIQILISSANYSFLKCTLST